MSTSGEPWATPGTVAGFAVAPPNPVLLRFAAMWPQPSRVLDIGCGAARNAVPLAKQGWHVVGVDTSRPMLDAAAARAAVEGVSDRVRLLEGAATALPAGTATVDLVVAHGVWNLLTSGEALRCAMAEAARVARPGAALFVFTFSRHTLPPDAEPVPGESFVYTQFAGRPQCFLREGELLQEVAKAGFLPDAAVPLTEYNRRAASTLAGGPPVIYEAAFRRE